MSKLLVLPQEISSYSKGKGTCQMLLVLLGKSTISLMKTFQRAQRIAVLLYVLLFLADAINVDEMLGLTSFQREDDVVDVDQSALLVPVPSLNSLKSLAISCNKLQAQKTKLELVDVDSPSLQASYISRDQVNLLIRQTQSLTIPHSPATNFSFYSLCRLQI